MKKPLVPEGEGWWMRVCVHARVCACLSVCQRVEWAPACACVSVRAWLGEGAAQRMKKPLLYEGEGWRRCVRTRARVCLSVCLSACLSVCLGVPARVRERACMFVFFCPCVGVHVSGIATTRVQCVLHFVIVGAEILPLITYL